MATNWDVIVVGGGLSGLAAGATAVQAGARTLVLEAHQPGGRARVMERDGFVFNMGAHALFVKGSGWRVLESLGITPVGTAPDLRRYRLLYEGLGHVMPISGASLLKTTALSARSKPQVARFLATMPMMSPDKLAGKSVSQWFEERDFRPDAMAVARALIRLSTYDNAHDDFSADAALSQLQSASKHGVLYLDGGWAQLICGLGCKVEVRQRASVRTIEPGANGVKVITEDGHHVAQSVVVAAGLPGAVLGLLPDDPGWGPMGEPVTAACLDVASARVAHPGYVLGVDDPLYATTQGPPARLAPEGRAVVGVLRYGARSADQDRRDLEVYLGHAGVAPDDVIFDRFLARMVVAGAQPSAARGGLRGRPGISSTGHRAIFVAGDWVGPRGLLADAALASGHAAGLAAARRAADRSITMVA